MLIAVLFLTVILPSFSQDQEVFAPFVSRLQANVDNGSIKLTWKDSNDIAGKIFVYRFTEEITAENFTEALKVAELEPGAEGFIDTPFDTKLYYYAVLIRGEGEKLYKIFIPFRNKTTIPLGLTRIITEEDLAAKITELSTTIQNDFVLLSFNSSAKDREITVYRNTTPIRTTDDLLKSTALRTLSSSKTTLQDFPVPGINYYYAIQDTTMVKLGKFFLKAGENTTILPAQIPLGVRVGLPTSAANRPLPLPLFPLTLNIETGTSLGLPTVYFPDTVGLDAKTREVLYKIYRSNPDYEAEEPAPYVFPEDRPGSLAGGGITTGGEAYTLKTIVNETIAAKDWQKASRELEDFLSLHRSENMELRAHFYLGQAYFLLRKYQQSFMEFLLVEDKFYTQTSVWMDAVFRKLRE